MPVKKVSKYAAKIQSRIKQDKDLVVEPSLSSHKQIKLQNRIKDTRY